MGGFIVHIVERTSKISFVPDHRAWMAVPSSILSNTITLLVASFHSHYIIAHLLSPELHTVSSCLFRYWSVLYSLVYIEIYLFWWRYMSSSSRNASIYQGTRENDNCAS
ncbi:uncharacterized protein K441DRAFT_244361 [Cenococcum geophilum 1.58]|uniref:uncharacterized protein n=1 Tax=Cenococcum geophilum 1.58 TaxID=794803 RepID=UPI00358FD6E7|nr:hypothetical protein K441DRAFT_244361 [Cenococcum geophilum 1.58]